ncbi:MAG TPA: hypothetical protein VLV78_04875 [Thermoanaerobaculia bacterium]|nr:hypothetical protein [Thermoanaerobaculia bacterium]
MSVGFWDIGAGVGFLPILLQLLNEEQNRFIFFEIHASIPAGLVSRPQRVRQWAQDIREKDTEPDDVDPQEISSNNVIDEDFFKRAEPIRRRLGLNSLIGLVPSMVAGIDEDDQQPFWNHFAATDRRAVLASTYGLREYARQAKQPFESAVGIVALSSLLVSLVPEITFHEPDTGCLFDYNRSRDSLVQNIRKPFIEEHCMDLLPSRYRAPAEGFVRVLSQDLPKRIAEQRTSPSPLAVEPTIASAPATEEQAQHASANLESTEDTFAHLAEFLAEQEPSQTLEPIPLRRIPTRLNYLMPRADALRIAEELLARLRERREFRNSPDLAVTAVVELLGTFGIAKGEAREAIRETLVKTWPESKDNKFIQRLLEE